MTIRTAVYLIVLGALGGISLDARIPEAECAGANVLSAAEKAAGWQLLFDGASKSGWHAYNKQSDEFWVIDGCMLKTAGTKDNLGADTRADLVTDKEYTNFELTLDWKATKGGNSGVIYGIVEDPKYKTPWVTGPEYQLIDDLGFAHPLDATQKAGSNYAMQAPDDAKKHLKPVGQWNTTKIVVNGAHVEHWLNGEKVLEFERWTPEWTAKKNAGKWKNAPDYGMAKTGRIAIQDHGSVFWFRNVKIREIK